MTTPKLTSKLDSLVRTLERFGSFDSNLLADELRFSCGRPSIAVGSGGSQVAASYFARCRTTLQHGGTLVQSPMELVCETCSLKGTDVWLFSASADNSDLSAAAKAAKYRGCERIIICTRNGAGRVAQWVKNNGGAVITVPVAEVKDGFLATHSLFASILALLLASNIAAGNPLSSQELISAVREHLVRSRKQDVRARLAEKYSALTRDMTLLVLADPRLMTATLLIETSIWETALCAVQTTDFRNFAHGRHTWLHHRASKTLVVAMTGERSRKVWQSAEAQLPSSTRTFQADYGACGRLSNVFAVIDGLGWLEAIGTAVGVDPGKPGIGEFGRVLYEDPVLEDVGDELNSAVRHKSAAAEFLDSTDRSEGDLPIAFETKLSALCEVEIGGLVLDYDGTVVTTKDRRKPPDPRIVQELQRLHSQGVAIAFASGRGKSLGVAVRDTFPDEIAKQILIGYYNGGYLRYADVDISEDRPIRDPIIDEIEEWFKEQDGNLVPDTMTFGSRQVEVGLKGSHRPHGIAAAVSACPAIAEGRARIVWSAHSFDIIPSTASKLRVVEALEKLIRPGQAVVSIGDSGTTDGNDFELLDRMLGISINAVCADVSGSWSVFGQEKSGPDALLQILQAMMSSDGSGIRLNRQALCLDRTVK